MTALAKLPGLKSCRRLFVSSLPPAARTTAPLSSPRIICASADQAPPNPQVGGCRKQACLIGACRVGPAQADAPCIRKS
jgi:hypothetical protein